MKWRAAVDRTVVAFGLTHAQYVLLATLYGLTLAGSRPSQRQLAEAAGLEPVYVSRLASALEHGGLIQRLEGATDTRAVELLLTPRGEETVIRAIAAVRELHQQLLRPLGGPGASAHRQFRSMLRRLLHEPLEGERPS